MRALPSSSGAVRGGLRPVQAEWDWQAQAACRTAEPELFFHPEGERGWRRRIRLAQALELCRACPVVDVCLDHALNTPEEYGIWGGLDTNQRKELSARRAADARAAG